MIYLLYGKDNFLKDQFIKKLKKQFGNCEMGINYILIDENSINSIIPDIETPAFGYDSKLIIAKNTGVFKKKNPTAEMLSDYLKENEIQGVELVFVEDEVEKNKLYNVISKIGTVKEFLELKPHELIKNIKSIANAYGVDIKENVAQYLIECVGTNMQDIINELRKLIEFAGKGGTIEKNDVDSLVIKKTESIIFELTDSLGQRNIKKSITVLNNLVFSREPLQVILIMLYRHFKKLWIVSQCSTPDVARYLKLKPNQSFLIKKYVSQAKYFSTEELEIIIQELAYLDEASKNGNADLGICLEAVLCRYCSPNL